MKCMKEVLRLLICMIGGLIGMVSCSTQKMPEGSLVRVEYTRSGTMAGYQYEGRVTQDSNGVFVLRAMKEMYGPLFEKTLDAEAMQRFHQIIEEEKMYKYKEVYRPLMKVLDGKRWSFKMEFSDGTIISSHGENASPSGEGLKRINELMQELVQDSQKKSN